MTFKETIFNYNINIEDYFTVIYEVETTTDMKDAAFQIAVGQSIGNPNVRNLWETDKMVEKYAARVQFIRGKYISIAFPIVNIDWYRDGISQLLCTIMGGQCDIDTITKCRVVDIYFPNSIQKYFKKPKFGLAGIREFTDQYNKPLLGGIIKPKTGLTPDQLLDMVKQLVDGGVDFIKEDEIMSNPDICRLEDRVSLISKYLQDKKVIYCYCINSDPRSILNRARFISEEGGNGIHVNFWSGFGAYNSLRQLDLPLFLHFQKSGDKVITHKKNAFGIDWPVICDIMGMVGVDSIHAGMYGGYLSDDEQDLHDIFSSLKVYNVLPILSCGMHPGLVDFIMNKFGNDWMANVGGAIHGHPGGSEAGVKAMRQAIDGKFGPEYWQAIGKWGYKTAK